MDRMEGEKCGYVSTGARLAVKSGPADCGNQTCRRERARDSDSVGILPIMEHQITTNLDCEYLKPCLPKEKRGE
jgi:hypothetical protein